VGEGKRKIKLMSKIPDNSVKYSIVVNSWPFENLNNRLQLVFQTIGSSKTQNTPYYEWGNDNSQNLLWLKSGISGVSMYPTKTKKKHKKQTKKKQKTKKVALIRFRYTTFSEYIIKDGSTSRASFSLDEHYNILLSIPSFWQQAGTTAFLRDFFFEFIILLIFARN
jgi:hypothetical protein